MNKQLIKLTQPKSVILLFSLMFSKLGMASLVSINSTYEDNSKGKTELKISKGSGFIIGLKCETPYANALATQKTKNNFCKDYFVVTASHVSQGERDLKINIILPSETIQITHKEIIGKTHDNWNDIEIFKIESNFIIERNIQPFVRCEYNRFDFSDLTCSNSFYGSNSGNQLRYHSMPASDGLWAIMEFDYLQSKFDQSPLSQLTFRALKKEKDENGSYYANPHKTDFYRWAFDNKKLILPHTIIPGMSGTPLISQSKDKTFLDYIVQPLHGIGIQTDFAFRESIFTTVQTLKDVLSLYFGTASSKPLKVTIPEPKWHYGTYLYRTVNLHNFTISQSLSALENTNDSGTRSDVNEHELNVNISDYSTDLKIKDNNTKRINKLLGFKINNNKESIPKVLWADIPTLNYLFEKNLVNDSENISKQLLIDDNQSDLKTLLAEKLLISNNEFKIQNNLLKNSFSGLISLFSDERYINRTYLDKLVTYRCSIDIIDNLFDIKVTRNDNASSLLFEFKLNEMGLKINNDNPIQTETQFRPLLFLNSNTNNTTKPQSYIVDIRQLFFTELYEIHSETANGFINPPSLDDILKGDGAKLKIRALKDEGETFNIPCYSREG